MAHVIAHLVTFANLAKQFTCAKSANVEKILKPSPPSVAPTATGEDTVHETLHFIIVVADVEGALPEAGRGCRWTARAVISPHIGRLKKW